MEAQRRKVIIISTSVLLHAAVLILLLIIYTSPEHEWIYFDTTQTSINTPETIFSEPMQQFSEPNTSTSPMPQQEEWAQLNPRASTLGGSMDLLNENFGVESESGDKWSEEDAPGSEEPEVAQETQTDTLFKPAAMSNGSADQYEIKADIISSDSQELTNELKIALSPRKKAAAKKRQAQQALAGITKGYLEQLKHEGENLIKTIGGDPTKMPSAEQLKYERYLAKIQWCLQNTHNINRDKCESHGPLEANMRVYFTLSRAGKMADFKIIQSSGNAFADRYIRLLFEQASLSFPPVPAYIKEDPYQLLYSVLICWNVASPLSMGLMRE